MSNIRGQGLRLGLLLFAATALPSASAFAQTQAGNPGARPAAPANGASPADDALDDETTVAEVDVVAPRDRPQPGAVIGDIKPELQLGPAEIQSYGVSSVSDLLSELAPELTSGRGRGAGGRPVILLNGRRISGFNEIRDLPTEAIMRVDILPEEVALKYGYAADQKVVNFVLRRRFRATTVEAGGGGSTQGGQATGSAETGLFRIRGDSRLNLDLKASASSAITEDERDLTPISAALPFDLIGNVTGAAAGEIDPALSALVGRTVTVAGLPAAAVTGQALTLGDFAGAAGVPNTSDIGRYRSLAAATKAFSANAVASRPFGTQTTGTLNVTLDANQSDSLRGLPGVTLTLPAGAPNSPFAQAVSLDRYVDAFGPLTQQTQSWTGHLARALNRDTGGWRMSLTGAYDHGYSLTRSDVGLDASALGAATAAGQIDPFAAWPSGLLSPRGRNKGLSVTDGVQVSALASGPLFRMPAGPANVSLRGSEGGDWLSADTVRNGVTQSTRLSRNTLSAQANVDLPITSRDKGVLPFLGDLSANATASVDDLSDFGVLTGVGAGFNWKPVTGLTLLVSHNRDRQAPTMTQLGGPVTVTEAARIFDYATGRTVDVRRLDGGNAALRGDDRQVTKIGLTWKPLPNLPRGHDLTLSANYIKSRIENATETFPAATAEIEAAFPDRFLRDAAGNLVQVDYRPVNFALERKTQLRWGLNYTRPFGPQPPARRFGPGSDGSAGPRLGDAPPPDAQDRPPEAASGPARAEGPPSGSGGPAYGGAGFRGPPGGGGRIQLAVYHTVYFTDDLLVRPGVPAIDLLNGGAAGSSGGQPRNLVQAQAGITRNGLGARLSANWSEGTLVRGAAGSPVGDLRFGAVTDVDLRLFANLGADRARVARHPWMRGARVTLAVTNIFDDRPSVRDSTGATPAGYQAAYLDPVGRSVKIGFRKLLF